jgi:ubiquinone/menaquinone biosynthesis C-methylase UbiE
MKDYMEKKWPKKLKKLTKAQKEISDDWLKYWLNLMPDKFGIYAKFNHGYVVRNAPKKFRTTLEVGCGDGEHFKSEILNPIQKKNYVAIDIRKNIIDVFKKKFPGINCFVSDCQKRQQFKNNSFDRIIAIHVLEHLPNLPGAARELHRVCNKNSGVLSIVLPCEGSLAYTIARKLTSERMFKARYKMPYKWYMESEHINSVDEVLEELGYYFDIKHSSFFPLKLPIYQLNLAIGFTLTPK